MFNTDINSGELTVDCLLAHDFSTVIVSDSDDIEGDPLFVDRVNRDYHLQNNSPAIDFCFEGISNTDFDVDFQLRGVDNLLVPNFNNEPDNVYDAGAYEYSDIFFKNGFD